MRDGSPGEQARPAASHPIFAIIKLANRRLIGVLDVDASGRRALRIVDRDAAGASRGRVRYSDFVMAREEGWLSDVDGDGLRWQLSPVGRSLLRKVKSASDLGSASIPQPRRSPTVAPDLAHQKPAFDPAESPLGWLRRRRDKNGRPMITSAQFEAGERLRADIWFGQMSPRVTVNWQAVGGRMNGSGKGLEVRDEVAAAQQRVSRALGAVGPSAAGLLLDVCGHLIGLEQAERSRGWPPRSGKIALQLALDELCRHYGLLRPQTPSADGRARIRHWGTDDFRPSSE